MYLSCYEGLLCSKRIRSIHRLIVLSDRSDRGQYRENRLFLAILESMSIDSV